MTMQHPISDMFTRIRNAQQRAKQDVSMPWSTLKQAVADVLKQEGYIIGYRVDEAQVGQTLVIELKYFEGKGVIDELKTISRPGLRVYKGYNDMPLVKNGMGEAIVSTAKGVMTARGARSSRVGGEIICYVS